jgi:hypothetical protein
MLTTKSAGYHHKAAAAIQDNNNLTLATGSARSKDNPTTLYYCWTHGAGPNKDHTSATCKLPQTGHRCEATMVNMLGGNNLIHRRRGETQVFVPPPRRVMALATTNNDN